ncbi:peptidoglycan-binding protein [Geodermatophilus sp. SYSU D00742]
MSAVWDRPWAEEANPSPAEAWLHEDEDEAGHELTVPPGELLAQPEGEAGGRQLWVPGAERVANPRSRGGTHVGGPWRFVFHTVEGRPGAEEFRRLAARHRTPPHLWAMPTADLLLQTIPLDRSAYALARPGTVHTNRRQAVQVEVWGFARDMATAPPEVLDWLARRVLAPVARLVPIDLADVRPAGTERCYGLRSPCRMSAEQWRRFNGVCGHKDVPDNAHWDPGGLDMAAIAARARALLSGGAPQQEDEVADRGRQRTIFSWPAETGGWTEDAGGHETWTGPDSSGSSGGSPWAAEAEEAVWDGEVHAGGAGGEAEGAGYGPPAGEAASGEGGVAVLPELLAAETATPGLTTRLAGLAALAVGPDLRRGSTGAAVAALQRVLTDLGHPLAADGDFGARTDAAVRAFQTRTGLSPDGVVGPRTKAALAAALTRRPPGPGPTPTPPAPVPGPGPIPIPVPAPCVQVPALADADRACLARDPSGFAGVPGIRAFAEQLAACAADRNRRLSGGSAPSKRALALADLGYLERDFADTLRGGHARWGQKCRLGAVARGWMYGRREEVDFATLGTGGRYQPIESYLPPAGGDRLEPMEGGGRGDFPVQPLLNQVLRGMRAGHPGTRGNNYSAKHGGGPFKGRGFSVDLYIGAGLDERGFWQRERAVAALLALDAACRSAGAAWRVLYNDHAVAAAVNRHTGLRQVVFVGDSSGGALNWHGPLILHFHLDVAPLRR